MTIHHEIEENPQPEPGIGELAQVLWRNAPFLLITSLVCGAISFAICLMLTKKYESTATVVFPKDNVSGLLSTFGVGSGSGPADPSAVLPMLGVAPSRQPSMEYADAVLQSYRAAELVNKELNLEARWGLSETLVMRRLRKNLGVERRVRDGLMVVKFVDPDPEVAAQIVNQYLRAYYAYTAENSVSAATRQRKFVQDQLNRSNKELKQSEQNLVQFEERNPEEVLESSPEATGRIFTQLVSRQMEADGKLEEARRGLEALKSLSLAHAAELRVDPGAPPPKDDPLYSVMQKELTDAKVNLDYLRLTRTDEHPDVVAAREQVAGLESMLSSKTDSLERAYSSGLTAELIQAQSKYAAALGVKESTDQLVEEFNVRTRGLPGPVMSYAALKRKYRVAESIDRMLQLELQRALIAESLESAKLEVLDEARPSDFPVFPRKGRLTLAGAALGFLIAAGFVLLRRTVR